MIANGGDVKQTMACSRQKELMRLVEILMPDSTGEAAQALHAAVSSAAEAFMERAAFEVRQAAQQELQDGLALIRKDVAMALMQLQNDLQQHVRTSVEQCFVNDRSLWKYVGEQPKFKVDLDPILSTPSPVMKMEEPSPVTSPEEPSPARHVQRSSSTPAMACMTVAAALHLSFESYFSANSAAASSEDGHEPNRMSPQGCRDAAARCAALVTSFLPRDEYSGRPVVPSLNLPMPGQHDDTPPLETITPVHVRTQIYYD